MRPPGLKGVDTREILTAAPWSTFNLTIQDHPSVQLGADALWVGRQDSVSAFYIWTGANYIWEAHPRTAGQRAGAFIGTSIRR